MTRLQAWLFRAALTAYPRAFRTRHAAEMRQAFEAELSLRTAREGRVAGWAWALRAAVDAAGQGCVERARRGPLPGHGGRRPERRRGGGMVDGMTTDLRLAVRSLRKAPGFTLAATLVLALGIGANTTVFSALKMAILAPAPFEEVERLVLVELTMEHEGRGDPPVDFAWSYPKFQALRSVEGRLIDPVVGYAGRSATITEAGPPARINLELVTPGYFEVLGLDPMVGRAFGPDEDDSAGSAMVAIVSHEMWKSRFSGDADVVGATFLLNGKRMEVVGVAPEGFDGLTGGSDMWIPMASAGEILFPSILTQARAHWFYVVGRLVPGATVDEARAQAASIGAGVAEQFPARDPGQVFSASARPLEDAWVNADARAAVWLLSAAAVLVLLVACANLSGLLLARARRQARDGAVRLAVGASRWRLIRASLVESAVLSSVGGAAGVLVALWGTRAMAAAWPRRFLGGGGGNLRVMDPGSLGLDATVLTFALMVTALTAVIFGLAPAVRASRADLAGRLKEGAGATERSGRALGLDSRSLMVGAQISFALVLLIGAALVGGSMKRLLDVDEGFDTRNLLTFDYALPVTSSHRDNPTAFHEAFVASLAALPGVEGVTLGCPPLRGHCWITRVDAIEGGPEIPQGEGPAIGLHMVGDRHFEMMGIPILRGRTLDERDGTDAHPTLVLDRLAADRLFPGEDPLGRRIRVGVSAEGKEELAEVVGVVGDVLYSGPDQERMPEAYFSFREYPDAGVTVTVRSEDDPLRMVPAVRSTLQEMDANLPIFQVMTMDTLVRRSTGDRQVVLALLALFALVTVLVAATGTWGIVAYSVADRRKELGLRIALGAGDGPLVGMVLRQSLSAAALGVALGLAGAWTGSRLLDAFLFETSSRDPAAFGAGVALMFGVVLVASYLPARRATRVDPVEALKAE